MVRGNVFRHESAVNVGKRNLHPSVADRRLKVRSYVTVTFLRSLPKSVIFAFFTSGSKEVQTLLNYINAHIVKFAEFRFVAWRMDEASRKMYFFTQ